MNRPRRRATPPWRAVSPVRAALLSRPFWAGFLFSALALARQRKATEAEILAAMPWTENDE